MNQRKLSPISLHTICLFIFFGVLSFGLKAQNQHDHHHFRAGVGLLHTYFKTETAQGEDYLALPSFGLDLEYWFNRQLGLGLHNDLELEILEILDSEGTEIERSFPIFLTLDLLWKPWKELVIVLGPGYEFAREENLLVFRAGIEYEVHINNGWSFSPTFFYDARFDSFGSWNYGVSFGRFF